MSNDQIFERTKVAGKTNVGSEAERTGPPKEKKSAFLKVQKKKSGQHFGADTIMKKSIKNICSKR